MVNLAISSQGRATVIVIEGSIDGKSAPDVQQRVLQTTLSLERIVMDLTKVDYLSSAGLRMLLLLYRQVKARNGTIVLAGVSAEINDVMENTGFRKFFVMADSVEAGLALLQ